MTIERGLFAGISSEACKRVRAEGGLLPFQSRLSCRAVCRKEKPVDIAALSVPRGNGKSFLCGKMVARSITPGDLTIRCPPWKTCTGCGFTSSSWDRAGIARQALGESQDYRWRIDGVEHLDSRTRVRVISSDSRRALGLGANVRIVIADEPGAWSPTAGRRLWDAITTALGKRK